MSDWKDFGNYKKCEMCGRLLALEYERDYCEGCEERKLFKDMREYIQLHDVTEHRLAEVFKVPRSKVRSMIADGGIEYAGKRSGPGAHCSRCGTAISFGTYCTSCMHMANPGKKAGVMHTASNNGMRGRGRSRFSDDKKK